MIDNLKDIHQTIKEHIYVWAVILGLILMSVLGILAVVGEPIFWCRGDGPWHKISFAVNWAGWGVLALGMYGILALLGDFIYSLIRRRK